MVWQKDRRGVSSRPMPFSEHGSRRKRVWRQMRSPQGADSDVSGSRFGRVWEQIRPPLGADADVHGTMFVDKYGICIVRQPHVLETPFSLDIQNCEFVFQLYQYKRSIPFP